MVWVNMMRWARQCTAPLVVAGAEPQHQTGWNRRPWVSGSGVWLRTGAAGVERVAGDRAVQAPRRGRLGRRAGSVKIYAHGRHTRQADRQGRSGWVERNEINHPDGCADPYAACGAWAERSVTAEPRNRDPEIGTDKTGTPPARSTATNHPLRRFGRFTRTRGRVVMLSESVFGGVMRHGQSRHAGVAFPAIPVRKTGTPLLIAAWRSHLH